MAVTACYYDGTPQVSLDERFLATYTQRYIVHADSVMGPKGIVNGAYALLGSGANDHFPQFADTYSFRPGGTTVESDGYAYARNFTADSYFDPKESRYVWRVSVTYSPLPDGKDPTDTNTDPILRETEYSTDWEVYTEVAEKDKDDKAIVNPCGRPFDVQLEVERSRSVLVASYNVETLADVVEKLLKYQDAVNSVTWDLDGLNIPARNALCRSITSSGLITEGANAYYRMNVRIAFREANQTWDEKIQSRGFGYFEQPETPESYVNTDIFTGEDIVEPVNLKADGTLAVLSAPINDPPHFSTFRVRKEVSFANIFNPSST